MEIKLAGSLGNSRYNLANKRLKNCEKVLNKYGVFFPPLYFGTLNIKLDQPFKTPETGEILISQEEIDKVAPGYNEWWKLIPIVSLNGRETTGFIYRTRQNSQWDDVAEVVTEDLRSWNNIQLLPGERIEIVVKLD